MTIATARQVTFNPPLASRELCELYSDADDVEWMQFLALCPRATPTENSHGWKNTPALLSH